MSDIRIILVDDHTLLRQGLKSMLEQEADLKIIAEAENGVTAVNLALELKPNIIIMDISMPEMNGIEAVRLISVQMPEIGILILSMHPEREFVIQSLKVGAKGFLVKSCAGSELITAIRTVAAHKTYLSPDISDVMIEEVVSTKKQGSKMLSGREMEILRHIAEGANTKTIAYQLEIGIKTVETHRQNLMKKLGISNLVDLTKYAIRNGIIKIE